MLYDAISCYIMQNDFIWCYMHTHTHLHTHRVMHMKKYEKMVWTEWSAMKQIIWMTMWFLYVFSSFPEYSGADCLSDSQVMPIRTAGAKPKVLWERCTWVVSGLTLVGHSYVECLVLHLPGMILRATASKRSWPTPSSMSTQPRAHWAWFRFHGWTGEHCYGPCQRLWSSVPCSTRACPWRPGLRFRFRATFSSTSGTWWGRNWKHPVVPLWVPWPWPERLSPTCRTWRWVWCALRPRSQLRVSKYGSFVYIVNEHSYFL